MKWIFDIFINQLMIEGKKEQAEKIVRNILLELKKHNRNPWKILWQAIKNGRPFISIKSSKLSGGTYQIPTPLSDDKQVALVVRWLIEEARGRREHGIVKQLVAEIIDASNGKGKVIRRRNQLHQLAENNQVYLRFRRGN